MTVGGLGCCVLTRSESSEQASSGSGSWLAARCSICSPLLLVKCAAVVSVVFSQVEQRIRGRDARLGGAHAVRCLL